MSDSRLQEIITRAVVGRAERTLTWCHKLVAEGMTHVLGVRVGRTTLTVEAEEGQPLVGLTVDCDLWCRNEEETKVIRTRCRTVHEVPVALRGEILGKSSTGVELVSGPRSTGVRVEGESIYIDVEATVQVEVSALTRLWIRTHDIDLSASTPDWDSTGDQSPFGSH